MPKTRKYVTLYRVRVDGHHVRLVSTEAVETEKLVTLTQWDWEFGSHVRIKRTLLERRGIAYSEEEAIKLALAHTWEMSEHHARGMEKWAKALKALQELQGGTE
jgi:hypothetical protein